MPITPPESSPAVGKRFKELGIPEECVIPCIIRDGKGIVPSGDTVLQTGDELVAVTTVQDEDVLERLLGGRNN